MWKTVVWLLPFVSLNVFAGENDTPHHTFFFYRCEGTVSVPVSNQTNAIRIEKVKPEKIPDLDYFSNLKIRGGTQLVARVFEQGRRGRVWEGTYVLKVVPSFESPWWGETEFTAGSPGFTGRVYSVMLRRREVVSGSIMLKDQTGAAVAGIRIDRTGGGELATNSWRNGGSTFDAADNFITDDDGRIGLSSWRDGEKSSLQLTSYRLSQRHGAQTIEVDAKTIESNCTIAVKVQPVRATFKVVVSTNDGGRLSQEAEEARSELRRILGDRPNGPHVRRVHHAGSSTTVGNTVDSGRYNRRSDEFEYRWLNPGEDYVVTQAEPPMAGWEVDETHDCRFTVPAEGAFRGTIRFRRSVSSETQSLPGKESECAVKQTEMEIRTVGMDGKPVGGVGVVIKNGMRNVSGITDDQGMWKAKTFLPATIAANKTLYKEETTDIGTTNRVVLRMRKWQVAEIRTATEGEGMQCSGNIIVLPVDCDEKVVMGQNDSPFGRFPLMALEGGEYNILFVVPKNVTNDGRGYVSSRHVRWADIQQSKDIRIPEWPNSPVKLLDIVASNGVDVVLNLTNRVWGAEKNARVAVTLKQVLGSQSICTGFWIMDADAASTTVTVPVKGVYDVFVTHVVLRGGRTAESNYYSGTVSIEEADVVNVGNVSRIDMDWRAIIRATNRMELLSGRDREAGKTQGSPFYDRHRPTQGRP